VRNYTRINTTRKSEVNVREVISRNVTCWAEINKLKHKGKIKTISDIAGIKMNEYGVMNEALWE
jgi:hypothetical protein